MAPQHHRARRLPIPEPPKPNPWLSADTGTQRGELTHEIILGLLPWVDERPRTATAIGLALMKQASERVRPATREQRILHADVVTMSRRYLVGLVPARPWRLLGVEFETAPGGGRVDAAWGHTDGHVFYDELKTGRRPNGWRSWYGQVTRYATDGLSRYGSAFLGVRVLLLSGQASVEYHLPGSTNPLRSIDPTPDRPFRSASHLNFPTKRAQPK